MIRLPRRSTRTYTLWPYTMLFRSKRVGAQHPGFDMTALEVADATLKASGWPDAETLREKRWIDCQPDFRSSHFLDGFGWPGGKYRLAPDWAAMGPDAAGMPALPDHWTSIEAASEVLPFRLVTAPARNFLN